MSVLSSTAVCIVEGDRVLYENYGRWHSTGVPVLWASVSKLITGAAIRSLIKQRVIQHDQPVSEILGYGSASFTIRSLVEHSSGLVRVLPEQEKDYISPYDGCTSERFDHQVGGRIPDLLSEASGYSNLGYAILARAIETVTQQPLLVALRDLVMTPLSLDGALLKSADCTPNVVSALSLRGSHLKDWTVTGPWVGAGGLTTTLTTMAAILSRSTDPGDVLDPRLPPSPWHGMAPVFNHDGALLRSGSLVLKVVGSGRIAVAHAVGGPTGTANVLAASAVKTAVRKLRRWS